jgi:hypothetical protein
VDDINPQLIGPTSPIHAAFLGSCFSLGDTNSWVPRSPHRRDVIERSLIHHGIRRAQTLRQDTHRVQRKMRRAADQKSSCGSGHSIQGTIAFAGVIDVQNGVAYEPQHPAIESSSKRRQDTKHWLRRGERKLVGDFIPCSPAAARGRKGEASAVLPNAYYARGDLSAPGAGRRRSPDRRRASMMCAR